MVMSHPAHGQVYSIQHYVIKFVSDLRQVGGILRMRRFPPPIELIATILLKYSSGVKHHPSPTPEMKDEFISQAKTTEGHRKKERQTINLGQYHKQHQEHIE
jgi:hypothetical protein